MALTPTSMSRGTYILGGPGRLQGESPAEAMTRGITADQTYRTTQLNQSNTLQQMALARSQEGRAQAQEARTQQEFERRQREAARAAAEAARNRAAVDAYIEGAGGGVRIPSAGLPVPGDIPAVSPVAPPAAAAPAAPVTPVAPPAAAPAATPAPAPAVTGGLRVPAAGAVQVASLDPTESFRLAFEANPELFGVQVADASGAVPAGAIPAPAAAGQPARVDFSGVPFDVYPDGRIVNTLTGTELPVTGEYDALRNRLLADAGVAGGTTASVAPSQFTTVDPQSSAFAQDIDSILRQGDIAGAINNIRTRLATGGYGPMGSPLGGFIGYLTDSPERAARRTAVSDVLDWLNNRTNERFLQENPDLIAQFAADPVGFVAQQRAAAGEEAPAPAPAETPAEPETPPEPVVEQPNNAGLRPNTGSPVQAAQDAAAADDIDLTQFYLRNPDRIFTDANELQSRRQYLDNLYNLYSQTRNVAGINALRTEYAQLALDEQMLNGQLALAGIQNNNFGPYQMLLQQRFPNSTVEVRPYTDGTMDVFIDGVAQYPADQRPTFAEVLEGLAGAYNADYIAQQQALATQAMERSQFIFQEGFQSELRMAEAYSQAQIERAFAEGTMTKIADNPDGSFVGQVIVNGVPRTITFVPTTTRDPVSGEEVIQFVPQAVDMTGLR